MLGAGEIRSHRITATKTEMHALPINNLDTLTVSLYKTEDISSDWEFKKNNPLNRLFDRFEDEQDLVKLSVKKVQKLIPILKSRPQQRDLVKKKRRIILVN